MSEFIEAMTEGLTESLEFLETESFSISGYDTPFSGHYDRGTASRSLGGSGQPGFKGEHTAKIVASVAQFAAVAAPLEQTLPNKRLTVKGILFRIVQVQADAIAVTLHLALPGKE